MKLASPLPDITHRFKWVWYRNFVVWSKFFKSSMAATIVEPLLYLVGLGLGLSQLIKDINGLSYIQYIAPGLVAYSAMNAATYECTYGSYARMTVQKTYDAIISTPVNIEEVVTGEIAFAASKAIFSSSVMLAVLAIFQLVPTWSALAIPIVTVTTGFVFASLAILFTSFSRSWDFFSYYFTLLIAPLFLLSGTFFPIDTLPFWVTVIAWFTPLFHSVELCRGLFLGEIGLGNFIQHIVWLLAFGTIVFLTAVRRIRKRVIL